MAFAQLESRDQIALIAAGFCQLLCLRIATELTAVLTHGRRLLPIGGGLALMLRRSLVNQPSSVTTSDGDGSAADDIYCVFESIIQFSVELRKLDLDVTETAMFAAATLVQQGRLGTNEVGKSQCLK